MNWKRKGALALAALMLLCLLPVSASAASQFTDIRDEETAQNVDVLQMMDIINGVTYNSFQPEGNLTRAQFTKMAVIALGQGEQAKGYQSFTIFPDVKSSHWAAGFINLAVRGEKKFISGYANGTFGPEQTITFGQAVTILMRLLGYTDQDVGMVWPTGYLNAAAAAGLTDGVQLDGNSSLTRAQAARLFVNLLGTKTKEGAATFGATVATAVKEDDILLDANTTTTEGAQAIETTSGVYALAGSHVPTLLQGRRGTLLLNSKNEAWGFVPSSVGSVKDIIVSSAKAGTITDMDGKEYTVTGTTQAIYKGEEKTYGDIFVNLRSGTKVTLHFGLTGKVECVFVSGSSSESVVVVGKGGGSTGLSGLAGGRTDYTIYKNGEVVTKDALKEYDVATYLPAENMIYISNIRLSGHYEHAYPNASAPTTVTMMGTEFEVLPAATASLSQFKVGDQVTLLFTQDFQVAGAVATSSLRANAIGIGTSKGGEATVELLDGITVKGQAASKTEYNGELVTVSSNSKGKLSLFPYKASIPAGGLNVVERKLGSTELAKNVKIMERVSNSPVVEIALEDIRLDKVGPEQIKLARYNDAGKIDLLILNNVTGDRFIYGIVKMEKHLDDNQAGLEGGSSENSYRTMMKIDAGETSSGLFQGVSELRGDDWGGVVMSKVGGQAADYVKLKKVPNITNEEWMDEETVMIKQTPYAVSEEVVCYNRTTGKWVTLAEARAFDESMTLYVDDFHVVRGIEVEN